MSLKLLVSSTGSLYIAIGMSNIYIIPIPLFKDDNYSVKVIKINNPSS